MEYKMSRRDSLKTAGMLLVGTAAATAGSAMGKESNSQLDVIGKIAKHGNIPLFSKAVKHGNLLYIAGIGDNTEGDIKSHTDSVLNEIEEYLTENGSSMEKVLKVNVYLNDIRDYDSMNEVFRGRFGENPPVRTTVACSGGIPLTSLIEIDCIAALD